MLQVWQGFAGEIKTDGCVEPGETPTAGLVDTMSESEK